MQPNGSFEVRSLPTLEALRTRRSVYVFEERCPDLGPVREALDAAVLAPNHHRTMPWRFAVVHGEGRRRLGDALAEAAQRIGRPTDPARAKAFQAPILVIAGISPRLDRPKVLAEEEVLAGAAAVQNLMVALHACGIGSIWTTGALIDSPELRAVAGLTGPHDRVIGLIYVGFEAEGSRLPVRRPRDHRDFTVWIDN